MKFKQLFTTLLVSFLLHSSSGFATVKFKDSPEEINRVTRLFDQGMSAEVPEVDVDYLTELEPVKQMNEYESFLSGQVIFDPSKIPNYLERAAEMRELYTGVTENVYRAALKLVSLRQHPDDQFLFIGRTPTWLMHATKMIAKNKQIPLDQFIHINFSGTPDCLFIREGFNCHYKNVVTPDRLEYFENYLASSGLKRNPNKLFVIDMIGQGASLNSFLRIIHHFYTIKQKSQVPNITFVGMGLADSHHGMRGFWDFQRNVDSMIHYNPTPELKGKGFIALSIDTIPLGIPQNTLDVLDNAMGQIAFNSGMPNYACDWDENRKGCYFSSQTVFQKVRDEVFAPAISKLWEKDNRKQITEKNLSEGKCDHCGKVGKKICSRCKKASYCSVECQKAAWKAHKQFCEKKS